MVFNRASFVFIIAAVLLVSTSALGCKPITAPGAVYAAPNGLFTLALPPGFEAVAGEPSIAETAASMGISHTGFYNAKTGERIAVAFFSVTHDPDQDVPVMRFGLTNMPLGDEWENMALYAMAGSIPVNPWDEATRTVLNDSTIRADLRSPESGAALSLYFEQRGETLAVLAASNPHEPARGAPGAAMLDTLLPTFVWPAPAVAP